MIVKMLTKLRILIRKISTLIKIIYQITLFKLKYPFVPIVFPFRFNKHCYLTYYSQGCQDVYISSLLFNVLENSKEISYIIDIGCNHPEHFSNSLFLEKYFGCKTIAIDPLHEFEAIWNLVRPNAKFIPAAIGNSEAIVKLNITDDNMFSALEGSNLKPLSRINSERLIKLEKLSSIVTSLGINKILLVCIDVEGFELEVLKSIDFSSVEVKCFLIENNSRNLMGDEEIRVFLREKGFMFYARFGYLDDLFINSNCHPNF